MQKIAKDRGGLCLSKKYLGAQKKLKWQCRYGHRWETTPAQIKHGHWCQICAVIRRSDNIEKMKMLAREMGGKCVSRSYINNGSPLVWECAQGHRWEATPNNIRKGTWCPECARKIRKPPHLVTIKELRGVAESRGGKCLSEEYVDINTKLLWECAEGHRWEAVQDSVKRGSWCPECAKNARRKTIEDAWALAVSRGGVCLSETYVDNQTKLLWECKKGHQWEATYNAVDQGTWCPVCGRKKQARGKQTFEKIKKIARERGGECLSKTYLGYRTQMRWRCALGHEWETVPAAILASHWCPKCADIARRDTIENLRTIARLRGGKCLSKKYIDQNTKLLWECSKGHRWMSVPVSIKSGTWCPECAIMERSHKTITKDDLDVIAVSREGKCLSDRYFNGRTKLRWECKDGHQWKAKLSVVQAGRWCPECEKKELKNSVTPWVAKLPVGAKESEPPPPAKNSRRRATHSKYTMEEIQEVARKLGGKCLSTTYKNCNIPLLWQCDCGHRWAMCFGSAISGSWCPVCGLKKRRRERGVFEVEDMESFALDRDCVWVKNGRIPPGPTDFWICDAGHLWEVSRQYATSVSWCPECGQPGKATGEGRNITEEQVKIKV